MIMSSGMVRSGLENPFPAPTRGAFLAGRIAQGKPGIPELPQGFRVVRLDWYYQAIYMPALTSAAVKIDNQRRERRRM
jgi:hypothetical protein